jgi:diacylglycerol kinase
LRFLKSVKYAAAGIRCFFITEQNGRIQGVIALLVIAAGIILKITPQHWIIILECIALVLCLEMINSAIEKVCNLISTEYNPTIKVIKDMSAGAVLLAVIIVSIIGCLVFLPYLSHLFYH